jgi:tRNA/tmRNA/rRNA uracil-C5-methylase (TrmA/RlmC/RlmD family)
MTARSIESESELTKLIVDCLCFD